MLMSRQIASGLVALGCAMTLQAQTPTSKEPNRTMPEQITLTGCVERADQVSGPVTAGTTVDSLSFVLIKATKGMPADSRTTGTSGTQAGAEKREHVPPRCGRFNTQPPRWSQG